MSMPRGEYHVRLGTWHRVAVGDVVTLQRGFDITKAEQSDGPYPVISSSGTTSTHSTYKVQGPGVVLGRKGLLGGVYFCDVPFWPHDTTLWVRDFHGNEPKFIYYWLQTLGLEQYDVGASNPTLNRNHVHLLPALIPDVPTQRKIAGILSAYDQLIENNNRRIKLLERMAERIYRQWFVDFRYPRHESVPLVRSELGPIPERWAVVAFTDLADILSGGTPRTTVAEYWDGDIPFFTPSDAPETIVATSTEKHLSQLGVDRCNSELYSPGTVFITARGTVGKVAMAAVPMAMSQSCYAIRGRNGVRQEFALFALMNHVGYLKTNTGGATFDTIIVDTFRRMRSIAPPRELIDAFASLAEPIIRTVASLQTQSENLRMTRAILLTRLISGELDVRDIAIGTPGTVG